MTKRETKPMKVTAPTVRRPSASTPPPIEQDEIDEIEESEEVPELPSLAARENPLEHLRVYVELLGMHARDRVTGYQGVIASVSFDLFGCVQYVLRPPVDKDGKLADAHWFDANRVQITNSARVMPIPPFALTPEAHAHGPAEKPARAI